MQKTGAESKPWETSVNSSSREVRIRVPFLFSVVHLSRGTLPRQSVRGTTGGTWNLLGNHQARVSPGFLGARFCPSTACMIKPV